MQPVEAFLQQYGIEYARHEHPAVFTCEEADEHCAHIPGLSCKNLFLKDKKGRRYFLLIMPAAKRTDLKAFGDLVGGRVNFASAEMLQEKLGVLPGSVSPFALLNDTATSVEIFCDQEVWNASIVGFHPNDNTATLELTQPMFRKFFEALGRSPMLI